MGGTGTGVGYAGQGTKGREWGTGHGVQRGRAAATELPHERRNAHTAATHGHTQNYVVELYKRNDQKGTTWVVL